MPGTLSGGRGWYRRSRFLIRVIFRRVMVSIVVSNKSFDLDEAGRDTLSQEPQVQVEL